MKKIYYLALAAPAAAGVSCTEKGVETKQSLSVEPLALTFEASGAPSQEIAVKAVGVEWDIEVAAASAEWLSASKNGSGGITVSVVDNKQAEDRLGAVVVTVPEDSDLKNKEITVTQKGSDNPETFGITLSETKLEFVAEGAEAKTVKVTAEGEGLTWEAVPGGDAAGWITIENVEGGFSVKVADNPDTKQREGVVTVTPSEESAEERSLIVMQAAKVLPPSISVNITEVQFDYKGNCLQHTGNYIVVTAVNTEWTYAMEEEDGTPADWIKVTQEERNWIIEVKPNAEQTERIGYFVIKAEADGVDDIRVKITQDAAKEHLTDLTDDVDISDVLKNSDIIVIPRNAWEPDNVVSNWDCRFWSDGIDYNENKWPPFSGTGEYVVLTMITSKITFNDENLYYIPDFGYPVSNVKEEANTITAGTVAEHNANMTIDSWYCRMEDGKVVAKAPIVGGVFDIQRDGDVYTVKVDFEDDMGFEINGEYAGKLNVVHVGSPRPNPEG